MFEFSSGRIELDWRPVRKRRDGQENILFLHEQKVHDGVLFSFIFCAARHLAFSSEDTFSGDLTLPTLTLLPYYLSPSFDGHRDRS